MKSSPISLANVFKFIDESFTFFSWQESQARFLGIVPGSSVLYRQSTSERDGCWQREREPESKGLR